MTRICVRRDSENRAVRRPILHQVFVWLSTVAVLLTSAGAANAEPSPSPSVSMGAEAPALVPDSAPSEPTVAVPSLDATGSEAAVVAPVPVEPVVLEPIGDSQVIEAPKPTEPILAESVVVTVGGGTADDSQWAPSATTPSLPDVVGALALGPSDRQAGGPSAGSRWDLLDTEYPRVADGDQVDVTTLTLGPDALGGAVFALNFDRSSESPGGAGWMNVSLDTTGMVTDGAGGLGDRLTLMVFPSCALTTPENASCVQGVALPTDNAGGVLTAMVPVDGDGVSAEGSGIGNARSGRLNPDSTALLTELAAAQGVHMVINGGTIVAAVSKANGPAGTFAATDLGMTGSWSVGEQSGSMSYSIPLTAPQVAQGSAPSLALTYNSATVDGHNISSNGQGSVIGDGWDINIPYIERQYLACKFDRLNDKTGDLCWQSPYANKPDEAAYVINLNGQTANLIWDGEVHAGAVGYFVDGVPNWRVSRLTGSSINGDDNGEYFKVETPDGSVFYFGYGATPGTGTPTNSVATVPAFGDDAGEPCNASGRCTQGYRWMLDVGVDATNVATLYTYTKTTNNYAVSGVTANSTAYTSEIVPQDITYGRTFTSLSAALGVVGGTVKFRTVGRCIEGASLNDYLGPAVTCPTKELTHASSYPDVPVDLICSAAPCTSAQSSPAFFHTTRVTGIEMYSGADSLVSQTVLVANFPPASDGGARSLWLDSVYTKYTGIDASTATTYRTEFIGHEMRNRVDPGEHDSELMRRRIVRILTDSGSAIDVDYTSDRATMTCPNDPADPVTSLTIPALAMDCYQVMLTEIDGTPKYGTFNKYLVNTVTVHDLVGGQPDMQTKYDYLGAPGWGYANDLLRPDGQNDQTWSSWRGYGQVRVSTLAPVPGAAPGAVPPVVSTTTNTYFRGVDTDYLSATDAHGRVEALTFDPPGVAPPEPPVDDAPSLQGMLFTSETRDADGALTSLSRNSYATQAWAPAASAVRAVPARSYVQDTATITVQQSPMDGVVVLANESKSWSYAPGSPDRDVFYASSTSSTTYNADALPIAETSETTDGTDTVTTRTTTDYVWGYGGTTVKHDNPGHTSGFGTAKHIVLPWESKTYSGTSKDALGLALTGHVKVLYDGKTEATNVPLAGLPTTEMTLGAKEAGATEDTWRIAKATYDTAGRIKSAQQPGDPDTRKTTWVYNVPSDQKGMDVKVTSPDLVVNHTWYDFRTDGPTRAVTTQPTETETQGQWTHYQYNAAGMLVAGWGPLQWNQSTAPGATVVPTVSYAYDIFTSVPALRTKPVVVTTMSLAGPNGSGGWVMANEAGTVRRSYQYLDGLLRPIETHSVAQDLVSGDHLVSATRYDALGQAAWSTGPFVVSGAAKASNPLANPDPSTLEQVTWSLHDTSWRPTGSEVKTHGTTISLSSTSASGLTTVATDPTGLKTIAVSDVAGRLVSQKQVPAGGTESTTPATTYAYSRAVEDVGLGLVQGGSRTTVTDTEGRATVLFTDFEGRKEWLDDPNSGYTSYEYDPNYSSRVTSIRAGADASSLTDVTTMAYDTPGRLTDRTSKVKIGDPETPLGVTSSSAHWEYGTGAAFSHVVSDWAKTVVDGVEYKLTHDYTYDTKHRPEEVWTTLPTQASLGDLAGRVYKTKAQYDDVTGVQKSTEFMTAIGGLPAETVTTGFDRLGRGVELRVGTSNFKLVKGVTWDATGLLTSRTYGDDVVRTLQYDLGTRSVSRMIARIEGGTVFQDDLYVRSGDTNSDGTVDGLSDGTLTSITDYAPPAEGQPSPVSQCYAYNGLNRLESAWTIAGSGSGCEASFAETATGSLDTTATKYATEWEYSTAGTIVSVDDLLPPTPTSRDYSYDLANPAAVASITNPDIPADGETPAVPVAADTFTYDDLGRMTERVTHEVVPDPVVPDAVTVATHTLALTWDASSNLVKTVLDGNSVVYVYDSSGQRVAQIGVTAATATAYLGATEVTDPNTATTATDDLKGSRYYSLGGATVAVRNASATNPGGTLSFLFGDVQGSAQVMVTHAVDAAGVVNLVTAPDVSRNAYTPYGATRGQGTSAENDNLTTTSHGWLNQVSDEASTGLVYLHARYYDPAVSRFLSPDPQMNLSDPKTLDPYRYAENNPITYSDASGLGPVCTGLSGTALANCNSYAKGTVNVMTGAAAKPKSLSIWAKINAYRKGAWGLVGGTAKSMLWDNIGPVMAYGFIKERKDQFHKMVDPATSYGKNWLGTAQSWWSFATGGGETLSGVVGHYDQMFTGGLFHTGNELDKWNGAGVLGGMLGLSLFFGGLKTTPRATVAEAAPLESGNLYINGSKSANNLTPRLTDADGLSAYNTIDRGIAAGGKGQCINAACLADGGLGAFKTGDLGHYSIRPLTQGGLDEWLASRVAGTEAESPFTQYIQAHAETIWNR